MSNYWINPETSDLTLSPAEENLHKAVKNLWEDEIETILQDNSLTQSVKKGLESENLTLDSNLQIRTLNESEWLTETNISMLHELGGIFVTGTKLQCESDDDFELILTADHQGMLSEDII